MVEVNMLWEVHLYVGGEDIGCIYVSAVPRKGETVLLTVDGGKERKLVVKDVVWQVFALDEKPGEGHYVDLMLEEGKVVAEEDL